MLEFRFRFTFNNAWCCPFSCGADCVLVVIVAPMCLATNSFVMLVLASQSIVSFMALVFVEHVNEW